jgi:Putative MetA-pathway of phenol degradation
MKPKRTLVENSYRLFLTLSTILVFAPFSLIHAQQPLETETARPLKKGQVEVQATFEYQTSKEGTERAAPLAFEFGLTDRLSLLVEPVLYTSIRPKLGRRASGFGDLEVTLSYLFAKEGRRRPALAIAGEIKAPTARDALIGTGKTDFAAYLFASKRFGKFDTHANVGYTFVGKPAAVQVSNTANFAFAVEYFANKKVTLLGEVLVNGLGKAEAQTCRAFPLSPLQKRQRASWLGQSAFATTSSGTLIFRSA